MFIASIPFGDFYVQLSGLLPICFNAPTEMVEISKIALSLWIAVFSQWYESANGRCVIAALDIPKSLKHFGGIKARHREENLPQIGICA